MLRKLHQHVWLLLASLVVFATFVMPMESIGDPTGDPIVEKSCEDPIETDVCVKVGVVPTLCCRPEGSKHYINYCPDVERWRHRINNTIHFRLQDPKTCTRGMYKFECEPYENPCKLTPSPKPPIDPIIGE